MTPLFLACANGNKAMIRLLLDAGADPNSSDPTGETALMAAVRVGSSAAVKLLLDRGATGRGQGSGVSADGADGGRAGESSRHRRSCSSLMARSRTRRPGSATRRRGSCRIRCPDSGTVLASCGADCPRAGCETRFQAGCRRSSMPLATAASTSRARSSRPGGCQPGRCQRHLAADRGDHQ